MWKMEDTIALKLYDTREKARKKAKSKVAVDKVAFTIKAPDRDSAVATLIKTEPNLQTNRNSQYTSTDPKQGSLF